MVLFNDATGAFCFILQIVRVSDFWHWSKHVYLANLYNLEWYHYTGGRRRALFVEGFSGHVIGVARLRRLRVKSGE